MSGGLAGVRRLLQVMARLRDPQLGCPWDQAQTPESIAPYTIEEACEVAQAAESGTPARLCEELGDLLFHVVFHARMAEEAERFTFDDVASGAARKLERRHPHVFGDAHRQELGDANARWESAKAAQRRGIEDGFPARLPALMAALKLQRRAASVGFDWPEQEGAREKVSEELAELDDAVADGPERVRDELGDLLFAVVNLARHLGVEPEQALRGANRKFSRRFRYIEAQLAERSLRPQQVELKELDALWEEAKEKERNSQREA